VFALSGGAAWAPRDARSSRLVPFVGGEATGHALRAIGDGKSGYAGRTVLVPGMSLGPVGGIWFLLGNDLALSVQGRAAWMLWEPVVAFVGRRVAGWQGADLALTVDLSLRL
jgi:hypothetical protein